MENEHSYAHNISNEDSEEKIKSSQISNRTMIKNHKEKNDNPIESDLQNSFQTTMTKYDKNHYLGTFNFESLISMEEILSYFLNTTKKCNDVFFINYYKVIRYYMLNTSINNIYKNKITTLSNKSVILEELFILQCLSVLIEGIYVLNSKNNNEQTLNIIKNIMILNHQNFLLFSKLLLKELTNNKMSNIYYIQISKLILKKLKNSYVTNNIFQNIEKTNDIINNYLKQVLTLNKLLFKSKDIYLPILRILKSIDKLSSNYIIDYCLKELSVPQKKISELKNITYLSCKDDEDATPLYYSVKIPFLPKINNSIKLTIVLDLDETLIRFNNGNLIKRPGLYNFLDKLLEENCELIIFTASNKEYADNIIDEIEIEKEYFNKRLYRENTVLIGSNYVKDISKLGRELSKTIIIDNDVTCFCLQKTNGILIKEFYANDIEEKNDKILFNLLKIILNIMKKPFDDIRKELKIYEKIIFETVTNNKN